MSLSCFSKACLILFFILSGCSVDKCNDYYVAYECTEKYGSECREHYLEMFKTCESDKE